MDRRPITPYYKNSAERDHAHLVSFTIGLALVVGAMLGACVVLALGGG